MDLYKIKFLEQFYYYSSGEEEVIFNNATYVRKPIARTELTLELNDSDIRLSVAIDLTPFTYYVRSSPSAELELTIYDYATGFELFNGILTETEFNLSTGMAEIKFKKKEFYFDSEVPYRSYGTTCSFDLFDSDCGVLKSVHSFLTFTFAVSSEKTSIVCSELSTYPNGTFTNGYVRLSTSEAFFITSHVGDTIYFDMPVLGVPNYIEVVKGCDKSFEQCGTKFSNSMKFGGFPFVPAKNPVTESI